MRMSKIAPSLGTARPGMCGFFLPFLSDGVPGSRYATRPALAHVCAVNCQHTSTVPVQRRHLMWSRWRMGSRTRRYVGGARWPHPRPKTKHTEHRVSFLDHSMETAARSVGSREHRSFVPLSLMDGSCTPPRLSP